MKQIPNEDTGQKAPALLEWTAPEFIKHTKGKVWFLVAGGLVAALVLYALWTGSITMAIAFIVLAGVYYISHHREPKNITIGLSDFGIKVGSRYIPYNQVKAFWIIYNPPFVKTLKLLSTDKILGEMNVQLGDQDPGSIRKIIIKHVPEFEGKEESFVDLVIRLTKL